MAGTSGPSPSGPSSAWSAPTPHQESTSYQESTSHQEPVSHQGPSVPTETAGPAETAETAGTAGTSAGPGPAGGGDVPGHYGPDDTARWVAEPDKRPGRTSFQRDRARVLHSSALRRLAGKTQVVTPGAPGEEWDASPRTRLTHSLECAQVGRELGAALGCDPDLVEAACLSHDMGHPPFGHNGERVLDEFAEDCGGFEGNAQSLRLLTRIEPKRFAPPGAGTVPEGAGVGLNLTRAALDAATKYPWTRATAEAGAAPGSRVKFGVYEDDLPVFAWVREGAPAGRTCFEAQVMDWSDDVAYSVHDFEDGLHAGYIDPAALASPAEREEIWAVALDRHTGPGTDPAELAAALDRLTAEEWWPHAHDGSAVAQGRLKDAASELIGRFCLAAETATRAAYGPGPLTRYGARLVVPRPARLECAVLKAVADRYVIQRAEQEAIRAGQRVVLAELAEALLDRAPFGLNPQFRALFEAAPDDAARKRAVVDQVASLTDAAARALHARVTGQH
ncbi:deoxyguanosinetriphosphate triphosphohydrolase [Streptomyces fuscigenes]|uniref:deoxyguanosinetriphosphate triphosphohydrolase n=1 Tax=Streptomyces fuscigenes TaxID=1528880 RepID=UPI001F314CD6|nr:deoxyguanosinetriphosphate triphosphohydrolase [Streptomyces fuscigenes]MCF3961102.1 deoxyguanosinetriphosphate triphosphohydrolase [Streptomyces fuscigenes]